jgi:glutathione S-transferase
MCAQVESQDHQIQIGIGMAAAELFRNSTPGFKNRALTGPHNYAQIPALAERGLLRVGHAFEDLNRHLGHNQFMVGDYFSIADITLYAFIGFARWAKLTIPEQCTDLQRWFDDVKSRPSAQA